MDKQYLTIGELQAYLGTSRTFIYNLINQGKLKKYQVNRRIYFNSEEVNNLFQKSQ